MPAAAGCAPGRCRGSVVPGQPERFGRDASGGLTYAEIARELSRPTSTVSREVARNGGPGGYRADRADQVARRRARRSGRTRSPAPGAGVRRGRAPEAVRRFEEHFTGLLVGTGMPWMASRVLVCLYTTDSGGVTAAELVRRLQVSPASVSKAVGLLEEQGLIRCECDARRRADRYVIGDDVWCRAVLASVRVNAALADGARQGAEVFGAGTPVGDRFEEMGRFLALLSRDLLEKAEYWRRQAGPPARDG
ncbi:helix-turn-helix domain-containing protein [Nocardiopsis composta]